MSDMTGLADIDAKRVMEVCGGVPNTQSLVKWMDELIEENVSLQVMLAESSDENRATRLCHYASQISSFRRIRDAALRALELAAGQPPDGGAKEPATGGVL